MSSYLLLFLFFTTATWAHYENEWEDNNSEDNIPPLTRMNSRNNLVKVISVKTFTCAAAGIFPDPDPLKCQTYYRCSAKLVLYTLTCPGTSAFNPVTLKCVGTVPPTCVPTTTTASTTTPTTPANTTSPTESTSPPTELTSPPTESTSPTTTSTTPLPPYNCTTAGIFAEPSNCTTYYRCTATLIAYTLYCPGTSMFDPDLLMCTTVTPAKCLPTTTAAPTAK